jgi:hypothetical protein
MLEHLTPLEKYLVPRQLTPQERRWVDEYCVNFNKARAAAAAGYKRGPVDRPAVKVAIELRLEEYRDMSILDAQYVRDYIKSVLDFHPTDYFTLDRSGQWIIAPAEFRQLPDSVKRLVERVETEVTRDGRILFKVVFLSKTMALALAARYTLIEKHAVVESQIPWDKVVEAVQNVGADRVEQRLMEYDGPERASRPVQAG